MNLGIIKRAVKEAELSICRHRLGAVIFKGNKIISSAHNEYRAKRIVHPCYKKLDFSLHAEVSAIVKARADLRRCSIFVLRLNKSGNFLLAKPCALCASYIEKAGITHVYFTTQTGEIQQCFNY